MTDVADEWKGTWVLEAWRDGRLVYWAEDATTDVLEWAQHFQTKADASEALRKMPPSGEWTIGIGHAP